MSRLLQNLNDEALDFTVILPYNGKSCKFEFLDIVSFEGEHYAVVAPLKEEYVEIFRINEIDTDNENYTLIEDETLLQQVFDIFEMKNSDEFDFQ